MKPVSYTHLDVYKRQLSFSALARLEERLPEGGRTVQVLNVWALPGTTDGAVAAVSYTHLKRLAEMERG